MKVDYTDALAEHNVFKLGQGEGELVEVLGVRMNWKVKAKDTGYTFSVFEMELPPGAGVPLHQHPYPEFFYVLEGSLDIQRIGADNQVEWLRCNAGECAHVPINAPHGSANRTEQPARYLSTSTYYHEAIFNEIGIVVQPDDAVSPVTPESIAQFSAVSARHQGYFIEADDSGRLMAR